ncbi:helix-turn-helix transcriptional regulator [Maridesulfovibrio sp.]|uniref:helix-turn-helix domain-containing protein n=1 Tax=Maridesulfovibrio sp. TaxID=2795000 RepID=UPI0029C9F0C2|nr:helix-turn-helix transcriptional regulator [Maridesulfovibrio sp.]
MATKQIKPELEEYTLRIKAFVKELELRQQDLANSADVKRPTIAAYLGQESQPSMSTLSKWCRDFRLNGHWLLTGEGEMLLSNKQGPSVDDTEEDPIVKRMREAQRILADAPPEVLYDVIKNITQGDTGKAEPHQSQKKAS